MKSKKVILFTLLFFSAFSFMAENPPYKNPELSPDERALDLLNRMTLKEKFAQMHNNSGGIERLGVRPYDWWNEALHGIARAGKATVFPQAIGLASTFDDTVVYEMFDIVSDEGRAKYHYFQIKS